MGNRNLKRLETGDLRLESQDSRPEIYRLCFRTCVTWFVICFLWSVAYCASADSNLIDEILKPANLKEEINLTGATLKEFIGTDPALSGLKEISLKTYILPRTAQVRTVLTEYSARVTTNEGWQSIRYSIDNDRSVLICGKEEDGIRNKLKIVIIEPPEFSEINLVGVMELAALNKLRSVIAQSMPSFDKAQPAGPFMSSPSQMGSRTAEQMDQMKAAIKKEREKALMEFYQIAEHHKQSGEYERALKIYENIMRPWQISNANEWMQVRIYEDAADCSERLGRFGQAEKYYKILMEKFGDEYDITLRVLPVLERLNGWDQPEKQIELLTEAIERYAAPSLRSDLGLVYQQTGTYEKALEQYKIIIDDHRNPHELAEAYLNAGICSEALSMVEEAKEYYTKLVERFHGDHRQGVMGEKALIRMERGDSQPSLGLGLRFGGVSPEDLRITTDFKNGRTVRVIGTQQPGVRITTVFKNGPAKAAGVKPGDILMAIDSEPTHNARSVIKIIGWDKNIGDEITLLIRRGAQKIEIPVTLIKTPEKSER